ncbi:MAG: hypothetical protein J7M34_02600 [Anaerolineae bacterium]|nr:hypothetical protein [Anaerolineae bacterium]
MDPQVGRLGFRIAFYVVFVSGVMLFFLQPGTAEFVVAVLSLVIGLVFATVIGVLAVVASRIRPPSVSSSTVDRGTDENHR